MSNNAKDLIGRLCDSRFPYFDPKSGTHKFKLRPVLVIGVERDFLPCDLTVLPVSKISKPENIDNDYDYQLTAKNHGKLKLKFDPSFVRTHKISTAHSKDLSFQHTDYSIRDLYEEDYQIIKEKFQKFSTELFLV